MLFVFKILFYLLYPFVYLIFFLRVRKNKEELNCKNERFGYKNAYKKEGEYVWFHGASVGEIISLAIVIEYYKKSFKDNILITTTTKTGNQTAKKLFPFATIQYIPYDLYYFVEIFLNYYKPKWCCLVDSEIWPCLIYVLHKKNINIYLINGQISEKSYLFWRILSFLNVFKKFRCIWTTSNELQTKFLSLKAKSVLIFPNLKFFANILPITNEIEHLKNWLNERPVWCFASTHYPEEKLAISLHSKLRTVIPDLVTIIVPRHPNRLFNFKDATFSSQLDTNKSILIHDKLGSIGNFYALSKIIVIGKTFSKVGGGHNPIEPLLFQNLVIFGKDMSNFKDIIKIWDKNILQCKDENELFECLKLYINSPKIIKNKVDPVYNKLLEIRKNSIDDLIDEIGR